jgi:penicillin amidase
VPIHIIGHNDRIAWGITNTGSDVQDLFIEKLDPKDAGRYLTPDGSQPFTTRQETIQVRDSDAVTISVRETRHGPVVSDLSDGPQPGTQADEVLAFASPGLRDDDQTADALYRINHAGNWDEFTAALRTFSYPQQNIAYADVDGNIGFYVAGRVPIRKAGDGSVPVPGSTGQYDWTGFIPFEKLPHSFNPASGRLINANNRVIGPNYPYELGRHWEEPYRAQRIAALIDRRQRHDVARMMRMQGDDTSLAARELLQLMLPMARTIRSPSTMQSAALTLLTDWTGDTSADLPQPLIFTAWLRELNRVIYGDDLGPDFASLSLSLRPTFIADVLTSQSEWCDDITTPAVESCEFQVQTAFRDALEQLGTAYGPVPQRWRWGDAHRVTFSHRVFGRIPILGPWLAVIMETPGDNFTINRGATSIRSTTTPFAHVHGASMRAIYDLDDLSNSRFIIAGGQSGNPLSPDYVDMTERWRDVAYVSIDDPESGAAHRLLLVPTDPTP